MTRREFLQAGGAGAVALSFPNLILEQGDFDLVVLNGRVVDPSSKLDAPRHIGIRGGRIAAISTSELRGRRTIDAAGMVVAPGFIDIIAHGHDLENDRLQLMDGVTTKLQMEAGALNVDEWYGLQSGKRMIHYGCAASHAAARRSVMGDRWAEALSTDSEIAKMAEIVDRGLREGGLGVGFGLEYQPGTTRWEVLEMFRVAGKFGASCHVHTRYGTLLEEQSNLTAIAEVLTASQVSGAPIHIVHVPSMALGNTARALQVIEEAQAKGFDVTCDFYPYTAFGTGISSEVFDEGWQTKFGIDYKDLQWAKTNERLTKETFEKYRAEGGTVIAHAIPELAVQAAVKSKATMVGSDGALTNGTGHPRAAGTFCRVLGHYSRDLKLISLPEAIAKMTIMPARRFEKRSPEFKRKGRVQVGADADLTIFDPNTVIDRATFDKPAQTSVGVNWVVIGGREAVSDGRLVEDSRLGRPLRARRQG